MPYKRKTNRPYGERMTRSFRVRCPPELGSALRAMRRLLGISISDAVRAGMVHALAWDAIPRAVAMIEDPSTTGAMRIKLVEFLRTCAKADLALNRPDVAEALRRAKRAKAGSRKDSDGSEDQKPEAGPGESVPTQSAGDHD
jgi:hypothetical protein